MKNLSTMSSTQLDNIKFILTDIDDTLTTEGRLKSDAYNAMERLSLSGYKVIPVTGRCAGWCDHIARCGQSMEWLEKTVLFFTNMII